jgi:hypothetical protein
MLAIFESLNPFICKKITSSGLDHVKPRMVLLNPTPHNNFHPHLYEKINGVWQNSGQLYPKDVPHN